MDAHTLNHPIRSWYESDFPITHWLVNFRNRHAGLTVAAHISLHPLPHYTTLCPQSNPTTDQSVVQCAQHLAALFEGSMAVSAVCRKLAVLSNDHTVCLMVGVPFTWSARHDAES